jgi:hypothetical protein
MTRLADLHRFIESTLAARRLGTPVFVRYLVQSQDKPAAVLPRLTLIAAQVRSWLGQPMERLYSLGQPKSGQVSLTVEYRGGATALLAWSGGLPRGTGVDILVLGNHGAIHHDAGLGALWDESLGGLDDKPDAALLASIERAVRSGRPENVAR